MIDDIFSKALQDLLAAHCAPAVVRAVEREGSGQGAQAATDLWKTIRDSGFANAMVPEAHGGAGLSMAEAFDLFELCGRFVVPLPLAETMLARAWAARRGVAMPDECVGLDWVESCAKSLLQSPGPGEQLDNQALRAAVIAAQMAGALQRVLEMTLNHANERQQFGRALGKFQAIQHQLALMAEHTLAARMAAQIGCAGFLNIGDVQPDGQDRLRAGIAKARASEAAVVVTDLAHSIHGAMGFTEAVDLQLFTRRLHLWRQTAGSESYWHRQVGDALVNQHNGTALDSLRTATDAPANTF
jgi:acyl-CoA dehydrogenase